ncbi:MAG: PilZ domain-containing protein [Alphaproteobacteria bacterium]
MSAAWQSSDFGARALRRDAARHVRLSVAERRQFKRGLVALHVNLKINGETFSAELLDISAGGAQLRCSIVPRDGAKIDVEVSGFGLIRACVVRRLPKAIAVEFDLTELQRAEFAEKLDRLLTAHA